MSRKVLVLAALGALLLLAGGWMTLTGGPDAPPAASPATSNRSSDTPTSTPRPETSAPTTSPRGKSTTSSSTKPPATSTPSSSSSSSATGEEGVDVPPAAQRATMIAAARTFVKDLSATDRSSKQWWSQLEPHLTAQAAADMKGMDPSWMPPMQLTEGGWVLANDPDAAADSHAGELTAQVLVPTDIGRVSVMLRPHESGRTYQVMQYTLPETQ